VLAEEQVGELREWAKGLTEDDRPEVRAAAKAILLLATDLLAARSQLLEDRWIKQALEEQEANLDWSLRNRLSRLVRGGRVVPSSTAESVEKSRCTASAEQTAPVDKHVESFPVPFRRPLVCDLCAPALFPWRRDQRPRWR
jgi:hypothetical protein